jgi:hypothetical protein
MTPDEQLLVIFGALHLVALAMGAVLFAMFLRSDGASNWRPPDDDDSGGGGNDRISDKPKTSPNGGIPIPLPDAIQSTVRLRSGHDRMADPGRRPVRRKVTTPEPARRRRVTPVR